MVVGTFVAVAAPIVIRASIGALFIAAAVRAQTVVEVPITEDLVNHQSEAAVSFLPMADVGSFLVIWADETTYPGSNIEGGLLYADGTSDEYLFVTMGFQSRDSPALAVDADSAFALTAFRDYRRTWLLGAPDIYAQWLDVTSGVETTVTEATTNFSVHIGDGSQEAPRIAAGGGVFLLVYEDGESGDDILAQVFAPGETSENVSLAVSEAPGLQDSPAVTWDDDVGLFLVVWSDERTEENTDLYAQWVDTNGALSGAEIIVSAREGDQVNPRVTSLSGAGSLIVWAENIGDETGSDVYGQLITGDGLVGPELALAATTATEKAPDISACAGGEDEDEDGDGWFAVAFESDRLEATRAAIWLQVLDAEGAPYGQSFPVSPAEGAQRDPRVACGGGVLALAWTDWRSAEDPGEDGVTCAVSEKNTEESCDDPMSDIFGAIVTVTEPPNNAPLQPQNEAPTDGASIDHVLEIIFVASEFSDLDGDSHSSSRWELCTDETCVEVIYDSGNNADLESHTLPADTLESSTAYYWRVRYSDSAGRTSAASTITSFTTLAGHVPNTPSHVYPEDGATDVAIRPTLRASDFSDPDKDAAAASEWQVCTDLYCTNLVVYDAVTEEPWTQHRVGIDLLEADTPYAWRVRYQDATGLLSAWSDATSFTTGTNQPPETPAALSPVDGTTVGDEVTLTASAFSDPDGDAHLTSEWKVCLEPFCQYVIAESGKTTKPMTSFSLAKGTLLPGNVYYWTVRYQDDSGSWSESSEPSSFHTETDLTPGEPLEGCGCRIARQNSTEAGTWLIAMLLVALRCYARGRTR